MDVNIGKLRLSFLLDLNLTDLTVRKDSTISIAVEQASLDMNMSGILSRQISMDGLEICRADMNIVLADTTQTQEDSTETSIPLLLNIGKVVMKQTHLALSIPHDSIHVETSIQETALEDARLDLQTGYYSIRSFILETDSLCYGTYRVDSIGLSLDNTIFKQKEKHIAFRQLELHTPHSSIQGTADVDLSALSPSQGGSLHAVLHGELGHEDVLSLGKPFIPQDLRKVYPNQPIIMDFKAEGNMDSICLSHVRMAIPQVIDINTEGVITHLPDSTAMTACLNWDIRTQDLNFIRKYLGIKNIALPPMSLNAKTELSGYNSLSTDALLQQGRGRAHLVASADLAHMTYNAKLDIASMQLHNFLPKDSLRILTAKAWIKGNGKDLLSAASQLQAQAKVQKLQYGKCDLGRMEAMAKLRKGEASFEIYSNNDILRLQACAAASIEKRKLIASDFILDLSQIDLYALRIAKKPLCASLVMHMQGSSNFKDTHRLTARADAMELVMQDTVFHPVELKLDADMTPEHISMNANAGDLAMEFYSQHGLDSLLYRMNNLFSVARKQLDSLCLRQDTLQTLLPSTRMHVTCGQRNPVSNIMRSVLGYTYSDLRFNFSSSPDKGIGGYGHLFALNTGGVIVDTIDWHIVQNTTGVNMDARIKNGPKNKVVVFETLLHTNLTPTGAETNLKFIDAHGKKGVDIGMEMEMQTDGIRMHMTPLNPIIAYRNFSINPDNFVELTKDGRLDALVNLLADDGTGAKLYSTPNEDALQDISFSINHFNLGELSQVIPYMPEIKGFLHGDIHYMQADSTQTLSADAMVQDMRYEGTPMGNVGLNIVYFPNNDGSHYVDAVISQNDKEIALLSGHYNGTQDNGYIDAVATLQDLPFSLADAFIPNHMARLEGFANGELSVVGDVNTPLLNGTISTKDLGIIAQDYNINIKVPDNTVTVDNSHITLDHLEAYAAGKTPLTLDGNIDISDTKNAVLNIEFDARNYLLINSPQKRDVLTYGKVYVDVNGRLWGNLDNLKMKGQLDILGNTNVSYVLKDSPITVQDQLSDIVTFCDFSDTIKAEPVKVARQSIDIQMNINIEQAATVHCILSEDGSDYIDLQGGGNLTMSYDLQNDVQLYGRYTIQKGTMKYSMIAIKLKDFRIESGSYVEFKGNMLNPTLAIKATEKVKASVPEEETSKNVNFDVGLTMSRTLEDMGLEFTLDSPEDMDIQNELSTMSAEDRGRLAVTLLVTGMYMNNKTSASKGGINYANTLNAYLQSAIIGLADKALSTIDLNVGVYNNSATESTDYSFSFAKRFWGNRISVIVGGKVSSGRNAVNSGESIIDNISVEYRLDKNSTRYVRLYYDRNFESIMEGELMEMGAGLVLRKKTESLGELFIFRKK